MNANSDRMSSTMPTEFPFEQLPLELQRKVIERFYDSPFKICATQQCRNDRGTWSTYSLSLTTTLQVAPLLASRAFRREALSALYATRGNTFVWSAPRTRIELVHLSDHFQRLCSTVSVLVIDKEAMVALRNLRTILPSLLLIEPTHVRFRGPIRSARIVIESSSSIFPVLQGDRDEKFRYNAIENTKKWLNPWYPRSHIHRDDLEGLAFSLPVQFDAAAIWQAEDERFCFPGSKLTYHVEVSQYHCHIRKRCFTRKINDPIPDRYPGTSRSHAEENFRRLVSTFSSVELGTTEEMQEATEY